MSKTIQVAIGLILVIGSFLGCVAESTQQPQKNMPVYGKVKGSFRYKWWNYYERGLSYVEGEFYTEALLDLKEAIRQRDTDQRMARTYGMHFVDYFPHREMGIVYYRTGEFDKARDELELSLKQFFSAKAGFYLDRVRKSLLDEKTQEVLPPKLFMGVVDNEIWTRADPVMIAGKAEDNNYVSRVTINQQPVFMEMSEKSFSFNKPVMLSHGRHEIDITAENLLGKISSKRLVIHVDRQGPMIMLDELIVSKSGSKKMVRVSGSIYDEAGVSSLVINGRPFSSEIRKEIFFEQKFEIDKDYFQLVAQDRLGNLTSADVSANISKAGVNGSNSILLACADSSMAGLISKAGFFGSRDKSAPIIHLKDWTDNQTVYFDKAYIEGRITDDTIVKKMTINHVPVLRREGKDIFFSYMAELNQGLNTIAIEGQDEAGNTVVRKIVITRKIPRALQIEERLSISVLPFEQNALISESALLFQENLINSLVSQNRFRIIEREKLDLILQEQKLSQTDLIDKQTALRIGKLIAAQAVITGKLIETGSGIEIVARIIDTQTAEILTVKDVFDETKTLQAFKLLSQGMALKVHMEFPLLEGLVLQLKGPQIFTDLGQDKVKIPRRIVIYREEPVIHPLTGKLLGADNIILGRAQISQVMPGMSRASMISGKIDTVKPLDKVITE